MLDEREMIEKIRTEAADSQRALARRAKVSEAWLSQVLSGEKPVGQTIPKALGYRKRVMYEKM